ncbi:TPA: lytic polysaccharide monooxygenase [Serratia odorifera]
MKFTKKILPLAVSLALPAAILAPTLAHAHGYISKPLTRNMMCKNQGGFWSGTPPTGGCQAYKATGNWQAPFTDVGGSTGSGWLNYETSIPDGKICSVNYPSLNTLVKNGDWPTTEVKPKSDGSIDLAYKYTAYHGTDHIAFYITKQEYNPAQPLKWSDLELLGRRDGANTPDANGETHFNFKLPAQQHGRHVIVAAWPVSAGHGTGEVFMSCADVKIDNEGISIPSWESIGEGLSASTNIAAKTVVRFRLFDKTKAGSVAFETEFTAANSMADKDWLHQLAKKINAGTNLVKVGILDAGNVTADKPSTYYGVYTKGNASYSYALYLEEATDNTPSVNAGKDIVITGTADTSRAYALNATTKNAVSYQWTIVSGQGTFWLQEKQGGGWVSTVNALQARALVPANKTGEATYRLTVKNKEGDTASDDVKVTVKADAQQNAPVAVINSVGDTIVGADVLALGAATSYFPDGRPIQEARFGWSFLGANAGKVQLSSTSGVGPIMKAKQPVTSAFDVTVQLKASDAKSGEYTTATKVIKVRP